MTVHMGLGFWVLYERRHFRWSWMEGMQLALGLTIPFLLTDHVLGTRVSLSLFGTEKGYAEVLLKFRVRDALAGVLQAILLLVVWIHGCIWLRLKPFYPRIRKPLLSIAVLLTTLALRRGRDDRGQCREAQRRPLPWVARAHSLRHRRPRGSRHRVRHWLRTPRAIHGDRRSGQRRLARAGFDKGAWAAKC
jgi:hypothetical protein